MEAVDLQELAERHGTPLYVYSRASIERQWRAFDEPFGERQHKVCYAVKACSNIAVLNVLARLGSGFDIVSGGELARVVRAEGNPSHTVFSGVGKRQDELVDALDAGVFCINVESSAELHLLDRVAKARNMEAKAALRINPDVKTQTHGHTATGHKESKFGIASEEALKLAAARYAAVRVIGLSVHVGSQITQLEPFLGAARHIVALADALRDQGIAIHHLDFGGGLGVVHNDETPPTPGEYVRALLGVVGERPYTPLVEPGRAIVSGAGTLLTRVLYVKKAGARNIAVVDAAMNDLMRPSLYDAYHEVDQVTRRGDAAPRIYDVVGPVCETGDRLALGRSLSIEQGDVLALLNAGAYGFSMASTYNSRCRPAEILVDGEKAHVIRERDNYDGLMAGEKLAPLTGA